MATGIAKNASIVAVKAESTEGTYAAPGSASDGYIQVLNDGFEIVPAKELLEREVLTSSIGKVTPRTGLKSVTASLPVEVKGFGTEGTAPEYGALLEACLGAKHSITTTTTTKAAGNTQTVLQIEDADISKFAVGDIVIVKQTGEHRVHAVTARTTGAGTATITVLPGRASGSFANSVVVSKSTTYYPANASHPSISVSIWLANQILQKAMGCRPVSLGIENFTTGQLASFNFGLEGLTFDEIDDAADHTPTYGTALPPIILNACLYQDGVDVRINEFTLNVENELGFITSTCSSTGRDSSRMTSRSVTGSFNPYKDDTSVTNFTKFNNNTAFSLFISAHNPSAVAGEIEMGSAVGIYLPNCITTEHSIGDQDGILTDVETFTASRGTDGNTNEVYIGFV